MKKLFSWVIDFLKNSGETEEGHRERLKRFARQAELKARLRAKFRKEQPNCRSANFWEAADWALQLEQEQKREEDDRLFERSQARASAIIKAVRKRKRRALLAADRAAWDKALNIVRKTFPDAVLAGGSICGHILGHPPSERNLLVAVPFTGTAEEALDKMVETGTAERGQWRHKGYVEMKGLMTGGAGMIYGSWSEAVGEWITQPNCCVRGDDVIVLDFEKSRKIEIVVVPATPEGLKATIRQTWAMPLNFGTYDGTAIDVPEEMAADIRAKRVSVLQHRLPASSVILSLLDKQVKDLSQKIRWQVCWR